MDKYQELVENVKEYIKKKEDSKGTALTDEDFACEDSPCKSKPETIIKDGKIFWVIDGVTIIDRSNEKLIDNSTTFNGLLRILASRSEAVEAAKEVAEEKEADEKEEKLRKEYGEDYDLIFDKKKTDSGRRQCLSASSLRAVTPHIAVIDIGNDGICEVFVNGYAVYDNGNRMTVVWVPDCGTATYFFSPLKYNEKLYLKQSDEVGMDVFGDAAWYNAVMVSGENRIEYNMMKHPKSKGTESESDFDDAAPASGWVGTSHFDDPETAYLKKEAAEERRKALTARQQKICELCFEDGMSIRKIANGYGVDFTTIREQVKSIKGKMKDDPERFFSTM